MRFLLLIAIGAVAASASAQNITVVQSKGPGPWGSARLVEELRIGELEGADEYTFGNVSDVAIGRDGSIFVAEGRPVGLRLFDSKGKFVKKIGRAGSGPGEYQQIDALKVLPDGHVAVRDGNQGRISILDPQGNFLRSFQLRTGFFTNDMFRVDNAGNFYAKATERAANGPPGQLWVKANAAGVIVDTFPVPTGKATDIQIYGGPHASRVYPMLSTLSPAGGMVSGSPLNYAIDIERPGQTTLRIKRDYQPLRLAGAEKEGSADRPISLWREFPTYDVFEPSGRFLGTVVAPPRASFMVMRGQNIWGVTRGELDEYYVVRYRIEPAR